MARGSEFITLEDGVLRQVVGPNSRHLARMESAYDVDLDAPGGGIRINGSPRDRADEVALRRSAKPPSHRRV